MPGVVVPGLAGLRDGSRPFSGRWRRRPRLRCGGLSGAEICREPLPRGGGASACTGLGGGRGVGFGSAEPGGAACGPRETRRGPWVRGQSPRPPRRCVAGVAGPRETRGEGAPCQVSWSVPGLLRAGVGGGGLSSRRPLCDGKTIARSRRARAHGVPGSGPAPWINELISSFGIYALKSGCALPPVYRRRNGQSGQLICHI